MANASEDGTNDPARADIDTEFGRQVRIRAARKSAARRRAKRTIWFGLGMFGLVGWSIAVPTLLGIALGVWMDKRWPGDVSWTLTLLIAGLVLGCLNAWYWLKQESESERNKNNNEAENETQED